MEVIVILFLVIVAAFVARGFWTTSRMSSKIFSVVERELDQMMANKNSPKRACAHCGSMSAATDKCPNCGASVAE